MEDASYRVITLLDHFRLLQGLKEFFPRVFFIPSGPNTPSGLGPLTERLRAAYGDEVVHVGRWGLEHKLLRDTPSCLPASVPGASSIPRFVHFLTMSHYPKLTFVYASEDISEAHPATTASGMVMRAMSNAAAGELFKHLARACEPIWCHRHTHAVMAGQVFDVGDFRVRIGEVRQTAPVARQRGAVVEIEWRGPSLITSPASAAYVDPDQEPPYIPTHAEISSEQTLTAHMIRQFWSRLGLGVVTADQQSAAAGGGGASSNSNSSSGVRESMLVSDLGRELNLRLEQRRQPGWRDREVRRRKKRQESIALVNSWGGGGGGAATGGVPGDVAEEDVDAIGPDLARQYMEIFRFTR